MNRLWRPAVLLVLDIAAGVGAILLAFAIRFNLDGRAIPVEFLDQFIAAQPVTIPLQILVYFSFGLYKQMWTHASIPELVRVVAAASVDVLVSASVIYVLPHSGFPRSVIIIGWFLKVAALGWIRLALRVRREWASIKKVANPTDAKTLIFGAGDAGTLLAREFAKHPELGCAIVGFIDDDPQKMGYRIAGKPVLGGRNDMARIVQEHGVSNLVIAMPSAQSTVIREIVNTGQALGLRLKTLPGLFELVNGKVSVTQIRDVQIEDLLGREEVRVDLGAMAGYLSNETVLVTGAGGSIGSELCRQVGRFSPRQLILLGHGENSIYEIHLELRQRFPNLEIHQVIADIKDEARVRQVFELFRPGVVFHAAAHKHVPLMENNPGEAIKNNVFGTLHLARAADFYRAKRFVLISSDKAVNPTSIMGATKRAAEFIVQCLARSSKTVFVAVRFGNVLGSRGSVIPLFKKQIAAGGPVTVTDPQMIRYFMTIPEAVQLVIQAAAMGHGGEIYVLDMGKPIRILDLARDLIRLSGFRPDVDIPIMFTGIRQGEKLFEELLTAEEGTLATQHQRIFTARSDSIRIGALQELLDNLSQLIVTGQATNERVRSVIGKVVGNVSLLSAAGVGD